MAAFVKAPRTRIFNNRKIKDGGKINVPGGDGTHQQPWNEDSVDREPGNVLLPQFSETPEGTAGQIIPIRICPHCGYEIRTWILGDLTCTRCENDIRGGDGAVASLYYRVSDISCAAVFPVRSETPLSGSGHNRYRSR